MKINNLPLAFMMVMLPACEQDPVQSPSFYDCQLQLEETDHPRAAEFQQLLQEIVQSGVPGMMLSVTDAQGSWSGAFGKADLASEVDLEPCHITRVGSTVKTFTAVTLLLLQEEELLSIDHQVTKYLSPEQLRDLENAQQVTIRQLLQHTSGIYNYIGSPQFQTASLNDLEKVWSPEELVDYARNRPAEFAPGTDAQYSNTNYILLGDIIEQVTGQPYYQVFQKKIFEPYRLEYTRCAAPDPVPQGIIRGYVDLYSKHQVIDATYYSGWDYYTADGGLIANAHDLRDFMTQLFNGAILSPASLEEMTSWVAPEEQDEEGFETYFGLGLFRIETSQGPAYMHSGDAIGYFATMVYFPQQQVTISWAANGNYGAIDEHTQSKEAMEKIFSTILQ